MKGSVSAEVPTTPASDDERASRRAPCPLPHSPPRRERPRDGGVSAAPLHRLAALLISAGRSVECGYNVAYARVTRPTTEHRNLPDVHHSVAIREHRREYERRFVAYFDEALL